MLPHLLARGVGVLSQGLALAKGGILAVYWELLPNNTPKLFPLWGFRKTFAWSLSGINRLVGLIGN